MDITIVWAHEQWTIIADYISRYQTNWLRHFYSAINHIKRQTKCHPMMVLNCPRWHMRRWRTVFSVYVLKSSRMPLTRSDMDHRVLPANNTVSAFTHKHSPGDATTHIRIANAWVQLTTHLSTPKRTNGCIGHVGSHTADIYTEVTHQLS